MIFSDRTENHWNQNLLDTLSAHALEYGDYFFGVVFGGFGASQILVLGLNVVPAAQYFGSMQASPAAQ